MPKQKQSSIFDLNVFFWKICCIWPGDNKYIKYFSWFHTFIIVFLYNVLMTLNLIYTPRNIDYLISETLFYFNEVAIVAKVVMVIVMRNRIIEAFNLLDGDELIADDESSDQIIVHCRKMYKRFHRILIILYHIGHFNHTYVPLLNHIIFDANLVLPISEYYFLSNEFKEKYFVYMYIFQVYGIYIQIMFNIHIDSFIAGLLYKLLIHCQIIKVKLFNLRLEDEEKALTYDEQEVIQMNKLKNVLKRYDTWIKFASVCQNILSASLFVQFTMTSLIICVSLYSFLLPLPTETRIFFITYVLVVTEEIFVPSYLGTQIKDAHENLVFAAYNTEWIPRSESFKRNIRIFVEHANNPIQVSALKILPLSLTTFTSMMKSAYSFFALLRRFQDS